MKPTTSRPREKQSPIGGNVSKLERAKPESQKRSFRAARITVRFSHSELAELNGRAVAAGLKIAEYIRREVTRGSELSTETELMLAEELRTRELLTRLWAASNEEELDGSGVQRIASQVAAIDARVLVARATGGLP